MGYARGGNHAKYDRRFILFTVCGFDFKGERLDGIIRSRLRLHAHKREHRADELIALHREDKPGRNAQRQQEHQHQQHNQKPTAASSSSARPAILKIVVLFFLEGTPRIICKHIVKPPQRIGRFGRLRCFC